MALLVTADLDWHDVEMATRTALPPYDRSLAGTLLAAREAVMAPIRPVLRDSDVTEQQWRVLRVLSNKGPTEPTSLAQAALLFPPSVARILKELLERKLIAREGHQRDKRRSIVSLTPRGEALIRAISSRTLQCYDDYNELFGESRLAALIAELRQLIDTIAPLADPESTRSSAAVAITIGDTELAPADAPVKRTTRTLKR